MRLVLVVLLIGALALPGHAAAPAGLPVKLASSTPPVPWYSSGIVAGRFGGVPVTGSYRGTAKIGFIVLSAEKVAFAYGGYTCARTGCTFTGIIAGLRVVRIPLPSNFRGTGVVALSMLPLHRDRRAWVDAVREWAKAHLGPDQSDRVVAEAARVTGT